MMGGRQVDVGRVARSTFFVLVVGSILLNAWSAIDVYIGRSADVAWDSDWALLNRGLSHIQGLGDTAKWWTGPWCMDVPFWRPLSSYAFWGMDLLWPQGYMLPRQVVHVCLHLCFIAAAGLFLWHLTRRFWLVMTSLWLFAGFRPWPVSAFFSELRPVNALLTDPKNIPDPLAGIAMMLSLTLLLRGRWKWSLVAAVVSVGFKEIGFTTWPLALMVLAYVHRGKLAWPDLIGAVRRNRPAIALWTSALLALIGIYIASVGIGYRVGNNSGWLWRMSIYLAGPVVTKLFMVDPIPAVVAILETAAVVLTRRTRLLPRFLILLLPLLVGVGADVFLLRSAWDLSLVECLLPQCRLVLIVTYTAWLLIAWSARHDWPTALLGFLMCGVSVVPAFMAAQTLAHTQYIPSVFLELAVAVALCESARRVLRCIGRQEIPGKMPN